MPGGDLVGKVVGASETIADAVRPHRRYAEPRLGAEDCRLVRRFPEPDREDLRKRACGDFQRAQPRPISAR